MKEREGRGKLRRARKRKQGEGREGRGEEHRSCWEAEAISPPSTVMTAAQVMEADAPGWSPSSASHHQRDFRDPNPSRWESPDRRHISLELRVGWGVVSNAEER